MWFVVSFAVAQDRGYVVDDVVIATQAGISPATVQTIARRACTPVCMLSADEIAMLLRSGVGVEIMEIMVGRRLTEAELADGRSHGPLWSVVVETPSAAPAATRAVTYDFSRPPPEPQESSRPGRAGAALSWLGVGTTLAGAAALAALAATEPDWETDPLEPPAAKARAAGVTISVVAVGLGVSWTGSGIAISALAK